MATVTFTDFEQEVLLALGRATIYAKPKSAARISVPAPDVVALVGSDYDSVASALYELRRCGVVEKSEEQGTYVWWIKPVWINEARA